MLPAELMIEVLLFALEDTRWSPVDLQRLASVCKYWRDMILGTPGFWHVFDSRHGHQACPLVLARNRIGPLDVHMAGREAPWYNTDLIPQLIQLITPESQRIRSLHFTVHPNTPYFQPFFETISLPSLTSLTVSVWPETVVPVPIHIGDGAPFRHLSLDSVTIPWDTPRLHGLEVLSLSNFHHSTPTFEQLHRILCSTPFLRHLSLCNWKPRSPRDYLTAEEITPITLPLLTNLEIRSLLERNNLSLLSMLDLPSLRKVHWVGENVLLLEWVPQLLRLSALCIKSSPELVISCRLSGSIWTLNITSKRWTNTPVEKDSVEPRPSVDLRIKKAGNVSALVEQVAMLLSDCNEVLFETNSEQAAKSARKQFLRSGAFFKVNVSPPPRS
ncbi:hypothetical protein FRC00_008186 [Tulasnella sp. 408]|nr:hypothetical protein FRC00_008186 [Tulasnella sp. 408]